MPENSQENPKNPLKLPRKLIKPVDPDLYPEGVKENEEYSKDLARKGGFGGKSEEVPTYLRKQQKDFKKLPKDKPPEKTSKN